MSLDLTAGTPASRSVAAVDTELTKERIKAVLVKVLGSRADPLILAGDTPLFKGGLGLDSFTVLNFLGELEAEFQIELLDQELKLESLSDINSLCRWVVSKCPPDGSTHRPLRVEAEETSPRKGVIVREPGQ